MAKRLNIDLQFTADTSKAAAQIEALQTALSNLTAGTTIPKNIPITEELIKAQKEAGRLKMVLDKSLNSKGTVDMGAFMSNFKNAGMSVQQLRDHMGALGPAGTKAFTQIARAISTADASFGVASKTLKEFGTTLKNTARWQATSSIMHGLISGVQDAFSYAQRLDKSLNDIRIVSGLSADEMARFAEQANKSAQALSTSTTRYTDAALIYYQQGAV